MHIYKTSRKSGFTLIELLTVIAIIAIIVGVFGLGLIGAVCMGNEWFTSDGALKKIQLADPSAVAIVDSERNIFHESIITVKETDGKTKKYRLNSNLLFNYAVTPIQSP